MRVTAVTVALMIKFSEGLAIGVTPKPSAGGPDVLMSAGSGLGVTDASEQGRAD